MARSLNHAVFTFDDGSSVVWRYLGKQLRYNREEKRYSIQVRVASSPAIDQFFETWDKPSQHTAEHFIKNAVKDAQRTKD